MTCFVKIVLLVSSFCLLPAIIYPQSSDLIFQNISTADGLPSDKVLAIYQDHQGFLWFGLDKGLARYDGYEFLLFQPDKDNPHSLHYRFISQIREDKKGDLWLLSGGGAAIERFDRQLRTFEHFLFFSQDTTYRRKDNIFHFFIDHSDDLWIVLKNGELIRFNPKTKKNHTISIKTRTDYREKAYSVRSSETTCMYRLFMRMLTKQFGSGHAVTVSPAMIVTMTHSSITNTIPPILNP